ncbi:MAG: Ig-like domain repeat protein, partial [Actinomycetales bacterium]
SDHDPSIIGFDADPAASTLEVTGPGSVRRGSDGTVKVTVSGSGDVPAATGTVTVKDGATTLDSAELVGGSATLSVDTSEIPVGARTLVVSYAGDGEHAAASATTRLTVLKAATGLTATSTSSVYGTSGTLTVQADPAATGLVYALADGELLAMGTLKAGQATLKLDPTALAPGSHEVEVFYGGNDVVDPADTTATHVVGWATSSLKASSSPSKLVVGKTKATVKATVTTKGFTASGGTVTVKSGTHTVGTGTVKDGVASVALRTFSTTGTKKLTVTWAGNAEATGSSASVTVTITKK